MSLYDIIKAAPRRGQVSVIQATTLYGTTPFMQAKWIGSDTYKATANIAIPSDGTTMTFHYTGSTADTGLGSNGVYDLSAAANDTVEELCNLVNASSNWRIMPIGALWSDVIHETSAIKLAELAATTLNTDAGISIYPDGSGCHQAGLYSGLSIGLTANQFQAGKKMRVDTPGYLGYQRQSNRYVNALTYIAEKLTFSNAAYGLIYIYDCDDIAQSDTLVQVLNPAATTTFGSFGTMQEALLTAPPGHRIVVRAIDSNEVFTAGNYLSTISYTYHEGGYDLIP